jgi:hypothetical protein
MPIDAHSIANWLIARLLRMIQPDFVIIVSDQSQSSLIKPNQVIFYVPRRAKKSFSAGRFPCSIMAVEN